MLLLILVALYGGAATATPIGAMQSSNDDGLNHSTRRPFLSPMGEPFLPIPEAPDGLQRWFGQADTDHDGALTLAELQREHHASDSDSFGGSPGEVGDGAPGGDFPN